MSQNAIVRIVAYGGSVLSLTGGLVPVQFTRARRRRVIVRQTVQILNTSFKELWLEANAVPIPVHTDTHSP